MLTWTFWLLLIPAVLTFGLIALATDKTLCLIQRAWRRYQVRRCTRPHTMGSYGKMPRHTTYESACVEMHANGILPQEYAERWRIYRQAGQLSQMLEDLDRRLELEGLATAQDKAARRIVH